MSIEAMTLVLNHSQAQGRAKLVLIGIANHQGEQGAWPSIETLARYANASERSVTRDIQDLEAMGELIVERNAAPIRGQYRTNLYWVNVQPSGVTDSASGVTNQVSEVTNQVVRGDTVVTQNVINLKENLKELNPRQVEDDFRVFYKIYPNKREPIAARKAWAKALLEATAEEIIEGARRFAADPNLPEKQFIKYPATWLNKGCWMDGPLPERQETPEEKQARELEVIRRKRDIDKENTARMLAEAKEAERTAVPVPKCPHGNSIISCKECLRKPVG